MEELVSIEGERGVTRTCIVGGLVGLRGVACGGEQLKKVGRAFA